jgi:hypothetical protein
VYLVEFVFKNSSKYMESVWQELKKQFLDIKDTHRETVLDVISKFHATGSVQDAPRCGTPSTLTEEMMTFLTNSCKVQAKQSRNGTRN